LHDLRVEIEEANGRSEESNAFVEAVRRDWRQASLSAADRGLCEFAAKLTRKQVPMTEGDLQGLRELGLSDRAILDAVHVISLFNYMTRVADGLGVQLDGFLRDEFPRDR